MRSYDSERQTVDGCFTGVNNTICSNFIPTLHNCWHCTIKKHFTNKKTTTEKNSDGLIFLS